MYLFFVFCCVLFLSIIACDNITCGFWNEVSTCKWWVFYFFVSIIKYLLPNYQYFLIFLQTSTHTLQSKMDCWELANYPSFNFVDSPTYTQEPVLCSIVFHGFPLCFINHWAAKDFASLILDFVNIVYQSRDELCDVFNWLSYCITIACPYFYDDLILYLQNLTNRDVGLEIFKFTFPTKDTDMSYMVGCAFRDNTPMYLNQIKRVLFGQYGWFNGNDRILRGFDCICNIHPKTVQRGLIVEFGTEGTVLFVFNVFLQQYPCTNV